MSILEEFVSMRCLSPDYRPSLDKAGLVDRAGPNVRRRTFSKPVRTSALKGLDVVDCSLFVLVTARVKTTARKYFTTIEPLRDGTIVGLNALDGALAKTLYKA